MGGGLAVNEKAAEPAHDSRRNVLLDGQHAPGAVAERLHPDSQHLVAIDRTDGEGMEFAAASVSRSGEEGHQHELSCRNGERVAHRVQRDFDGAIGDRTRRNDNVRPRSQPQIPGKKLYGSTEELQADLDQLLEEFNLHQAASGSLLLRQNPDAELP